MSQSKMETLQRYGAKITRYGNDCVEAEVKARETAQVLTCHQSTVIFPQILDSSGSVTTFCHTIVILYYLGFVPKTVLKSHLNKHMTCV